MSHKKNDITKDKKRKKRIVHSVDYYNITEHVNNIKGDNEQKKIRCDFAMGLNSLLEEKEIDQDTFAEDIGISTGSLSNYRNGTREPTVTILKKMADKLEVSTDYLLGLSECPNIEYKEINKMIGLSQKAIEQLYKFQHDYFVFDDIDIDITEKQKISEFYRSHLDILNYIIENNGVLFLMLDNIDRYQKQYEILSNYEKTEKDKNKLKADELKEKLDFYKFRALQNFSLYIEDFAKDKKEKTTNVVIYAKYHNSKIEPSIEFQLQKCYEYAKENKLTVIGEYIDKSIDNRKNFQQMIEDSKNKTFKGVLVSSIDRFSRNKYDSTIYKYELKKNGIKVISASENITDDANEILLESALDGLKEYYSTIINKENENQIRKGRDKN